MGPTGSAGGSGPMDPPASYAVGVNELIPQVTVV